MNQKIKWLLYSVLGLITFGFGLSLLGEAIIMKYQESSYWVYFGSFALVVTNTGLCIFGQAVIEKIKFES
tara:strand:+ start:593 stop:802 length:210 start_codon:yes stop_codon:yes gene_type:complete